MFLILDAVDEREGAVVPDRLPASPEMKKAVLPEIANGNLKCCFALTEPNAGSNTFRIESYAKKDGGGFKLNGQKVFITGADVADKMLVVARTTSRKACEEQGLPKAFGLSLCRLLVTTSVQQ